MAGTATCRRCGAAFKMSPAGRTVNCPDCRGDVKKPLPQSTSTGGKAKPNPRTFNSMWDHLYDHHGGRFPANEQSLEVLQSIHEREHATGAHVNHEHR